MIIVNNGFNCVDKVSREFSVDDSFCGATEGKRETKVVVEFSIRVIEVFL